MPTVGIIGSGTMGAGLAQGLNVHAGRLTCEAVGQALSLPWVTPAVALAG